MKRLLAQYPNVSRIILATLLFAVVLVLSIIFNKGVVKQYFPYTAPILLFLATWFFYKGEGKTLKAIGLNFSLRNLLCLPLGILIGAFAFFGAKYLRAVLVGETFELSLSIDYSTILYAFYFILPQVATEELLFRGYLFKKTIEIFNVVVANVIFSILFMLIHVLDEGVLNNMGMIVMLGISIPVGHLLFATGLLKCKTLYFPIGLHLGNNWATRHLISSGNSGESIFFIPNTVVFDTWTPFIAMLILFNGFYLLVTFLIWKWNDLLLFRRKT
ncbi:CPBP family intramembrane glutamic endopeptidase [Mangrovimonas cancribranchiae]|uniref:Type II CAAX endopeptidase family protein n=1 Tax=Mangrovimonas cancribranchiae TaxID=3080055 RepID=A0AAU6P1G9_9FLAO